MLLDLLEVWKQDALCFEMFDDPRVVLSSYIRAKMNHSRSRPYGSKVWANEIIHGAPTLGAKLDASLYDWAKMKEAKIRQWVEDEPHPAGGAFQPAVHDLGLDPALCRLRSPSEYFE